MNTCYTVSGIVAFVLLVLVYVLIMPEERRESMGDFSAFLHDVFRFKKLYLEAILRFFYVSITLGCISFGFFLIFAKRGGFAAGMGVMILGPIITRITFELSMLVILIVSKLTDIDRKMDRIPGSTSKSDPVKKTGLPPVDDRPPAPEPVPIPVPSPVPAPEPTPAPVVPPVDIRKYCPKCGTPVTDGVFCPKCGTRVNGDDWA